MRAVVCTAYGGPEVLSLAEVVKPTPRADQVRIKVHVTTVTAACGLMRRADTLTARLVLGLRRPRRRFQVMGIEVAGEVDAIGAAATRFRVGDRVFGFAARRGDVRRTSVLGARLARADPALPIVRRGCVARGRPHHRALLPTRSCAHRARRQGADRGGVWQHRQRGVQIAHHSAPR